MGQKPGTPPLFSAPAPDFDRPLEMLAACHDRIEDRCEVLERLVEHLRAHGCDEQAGQAATSVLRYFDTAGEHHHEDEESDLFPLVAARADVAPGVLQLIARLRSDHREMRTLWQALRAALQQVAAGSAAGLDAALVARFASLYRAHIALEEAEMLPLAARVLTQDEQAALGAVMARRRGVRP